MASDARSFADTGKEPIYGAGGLPEGVLLAVQIAAAVALIVSLYIIHRHLQQPASTRWQTAFQVAWIFWIFAPPIWFSIEYFFLYKHFAVPGTFEAFKYGQELAYRTWVGIATAMTILYVKST